VLETPPGAACRHPARSDRTASRRRVRGSRQIEDTCMEETELAPARAWEQGTPATDGLQCCLCARGTRRAGLAQPQGFRPGDACGPGGHACFFAIRAAV